MPYDLRCSSKEGLTGEMRKSVQFGGLLGKHGLARAWSVGGAHMNPNSLGYFSCYCTLDRTEDGVVSYVSSWSSFLLCSFVDHHVNFCKEGLRSLQRSTELISWCAGQGIGSASFSERSGLFRFGYSIIGWLSLLPLLANGTAIHRTATNPRCLSQWIRARCFNSTEANGVGPA